MDYLIPAESEITKAGHAYDSKYGQMEKALWCLSRNCREFLLQGQVVPATETLIWTLKSWWGVQGVSKGSKCLMAKALSQLKWSEALFQPLKHLPAGAEEFAYTFVTDFVSKSIQLGVPRQEYSLASKTLHWLLPWRIPVYDRFVRKSLGIPEWDHPEAYRAMIFKLFSMVRKIEQTESAWLGQVEPASPLRVLDKYFWWKGGGSSGKAVEVRDPWQVVRLLGLECD